ncbi:hypothetical protein EUX98_g7078 [Antrodiella citrinella]|uniref:DUF7702 domain-containing protein n=1 Tax=Antrodiella citrinella TaxID=2447956 RepID=A0A4S4MMQ7_9APHY|nr:hypothetical protein EUX98_g7078 [Antrodiella citrinella]
MGLDARGGISVLQLLIYIPILVFSAILVKRHGFRKQGGWIFLLILSIVRIIGSGAHIAAELSSDPSVGLITTFLILDNVGLSPLIGCTIGFLTTVGAGTFDNDKRFTLGLRLLGLLATIATILTIVGAIDVSDAKDQSDINSAINYRHIGGIMYLLLFLFVVMTYGFFWSNKDSIALTKRALFVGLSAVLPLLFIRTLYSLLSDFAPIAIPPATATTNSLSKFSNTTGSWEIYLVMSVICEVASVVTYLVVGMRTPVGEETSQAHPMGSVPDASRSTFDTSFDPSYSKPY